MTEEQMKLMHQASECLKAAIMLTVVPEENEAEFDRLMDEHERLFNEIDRLDNT